MPSQTRECRHWGLNSEGVKRKGSMDIQAKNYRGYNEREGKTQRPKTTWRGGVS